MTSAVIKFPIGRVVREHRIGGLQHGSPELDAIERSASSIRRAVVSLRRQEATLNLLAVRARKKVTPDQRELARAANMSRIYAREADAAESDDGGSAA